MYDPGLPETASGRAHHDSTATRTDLRALPRDGRAAHQNPSRLRTGAAGPRPDPARGPDTQERGKASPIGHRMTEEIDVEMKEDQEDAQHTEQKNIKSSSARHTNESPYQVESKSSLRRQISLTKNLRKGRDALKNLHSNEDLDELELMNDDDFVRAPLNLDMEISQDAIETH